ncbi:MAG TPA: exodeoxyribonuclease VII large subunit [Candidatus Dormibacteraeota bacterium]|nr:exodeoxyribonuclease VII large subunit [Candidatus Dormibacteraeota bacterium]
MPETTDLVVSVSQFVALLNQTLEYAYSSVIISGELANFRVSKNKWLYFDLKDELASVRFFGSVYHLPGPLEDGLLLKVRGTPRLHPTYGFSINIMSIQLSGTGTIRRAAELLKVQLMKEGLFDASRKRLIPYPPQRIGLITSRGSAAYADFIKILNSRWSALEIQLIDVQVQGESAPQQIVQAIEQFNQLANPPEAIVIIRGGGSADDLSAFSSEQVTRSVAASRVPTLVAIGHEVDISLSELAADQRASTPSNAAELLVPDKQQVLMSLADYSQQLRQSVQTIIVIAEQGLNGYIKQSKQLLLALMRSQQLFIDSQEQILKALSPRAILDRGYAIVRRGGRVLRGGSLDRGAIVDVEMAKLNFRATVARVVTNERQE